MILQRLLSHSLSIWALAFFVTLAVPATAPLADTDSASAEADSTAAEENAEALLEDALQAFDRMLERPRFVKALDEARAVIVFPSLLKAGYFVGGKSGSGVLMKRNQDGGWSYPAFVQILGGTFGVQIGVSVSQVILVIRSEPALEAMLDGNLELGGDFAVAVGPAAIDAGVDTSIDVLTFTVSKGLYAGLTLEGSTVVKSVKRNRALYGADMTMRDIVVRGRASSEPAERFREQLDALMGDL